MSRHGLRMPISTKVAGFGLLYVTVVGGYDQAVSPRFNHRMAKVEFTLMAGEGVTEEKRMK